MNNNFFWLILSLTVVLAFQCNHQSICACRRAATRHYCPYSLYSLDAGWDERLLNGTFWADPCKQYADEVEQECRDEYGDMDTQTWWWAFIGDNGTEIFPNGVHRYANGSVLYPDGSTAYPTDIVV